MRLEVVVVVVVLGWWWGGGGPGLKKNSTVTTLAGLSLMQTEVLNNEKGLGTATLVLLKTRPVGQGISVSPPL